MKVGQTVQTTEGPMTLIEAIRLRNRKVRRVVVVRKTRSGGLLLGEKRTLTTKALSKLMVK
jgi:hypothetical protein